jgi:hypothetical protein
MQGVEGEIKLIHITKLSLFLTLSIGLHHTVPSSGSTPQYHGDNNTRATAAEILQYPQAGRPLYINNEKVKNCADMDFAVPSVGSNPVHPK